MAQASKPNQCQINGCRRHKATWVDIEGDFVEVCDWHGEKLGAKPIKVANIHQWMKNRSLDK